MGQDIENLNQREEIILGKKVIKDLESEYEDIEFVGVRDRNYIPKNHFLDRLKLKGLDEEHAEKLLEFLKIRGIIITVQTKFILRV